jgi:hypothetical protein
MRPTWPTGVTIDTAALMFRGEPERLEFDVENWGGISVSF